jgi:FkbM family methyltransferase
MRSHRRDRRPGNLLSEAVIKLFEPVLRLVTGSRNNIRQITLDEAGASLVCYVWEDSLWVAVKDIALLSVYERAGVRLSYVTGTVIDAGAHVGLFSVRASLYARRVISLEPNPLNFSVLQLNIMRNGLKNVSALPVALWTVDGEAAFYEGGHSHDGSIAWKGPSSRSVQAVTLEQLVEMYGRIGLLKVDIEGAEFEVLMSASDHVLDNIDLIVAELDLTPGRDEHELRLRLEASGYEVTLLDPPIMSTAESIRKIAKNWRGLGGATRLKIFVAVVYLVEPTLRGLVRSGDRVRQMGPRYLFAKRGQAKPAAKTYPGPPTR